MNFFGLGSSKAPPSEKKVQKPIQLLVIQADKYDWGEIFQGVEINGRTIKVVQRGWGDLLISSQNYGGNKLIVDCRAFTKPFVKNESSKRRLTIKPDFVLIRNEVRTPHGDFRNKLIGLMYANVPSINSLSSIYMFCDRPVVMAELNRLNAIHGDDFPIIKQEYYDCDRSMMYSYTFPCVAKVGYAHAGLGKMRIQNHHDFEDFRSVMALSKDYVTAEPFLKGTYDLRIQKCGSTIRVFKRISMNGSWKTNTGTAHLEEIALTEDYKRWAELASTMFGGLDICTVDAIHNSEDGKEYILEVNGTSSGWCPDYEHQDNKDVRNMIVEKLSMLFPNEQEEAA